MPSTAASTGHTSPPPQPSSAADSSSSLPPTTQNSIAAAKRPWREFLDVSALSPPISFTEATYRIKRNLYNFRINYAEVLLIVLFVCLAYGYHAVVIIAFMFTLAMWSYFFIYRDGEPLVIFNRTIDDRTLTVVLSVITLVVLILSHVWLNLLVSMAIGGFLVCFHGAIRAPDDVDDLESPYGALLSGDNAPTGAFSLF